MDETIWIENEKQNRKQHTPPNRFIQKCMDNGAADCTNECWPWPRINSIFDTNVCVWLRINWFWFIRLCARAHQFSDDLQRWTASSRNGKSYMAGSCLSFRDAFLHRNQIFLLRWHHHCAGFTRNHARTTSSTLNRKWKSILWKGRAQSILPKTRQLQIHGTYWVRQFIFICKQRLGSQAKQFVARYLVIRLCMEGRNELPVSNTQTSLYRTIVLHLQMIFVVAVG